MPNRGNLQPGGKSLSGDGYSPRLTVRLADDVMVKFKSLAADRKMSPAKLARQVLTEWVERHKGSDQ